MIPKGWKGANAIITCNVTIAYRQVSNNICKLILTVSDTDSSVFYHQSERRDICLWFENVLTRGELYVSGRKELCKVLILIKSHPS